MLMFLVIRKVDCEPDLTYSLMNAANLVKYLSFNDIYDEEYTIFYLENTNVIPCHYVGWQPSCKIEIIRDDTGESLYVGYGEDH